MTGDELIAEGRRLARPSVHLIPDGELECLAAVWGGPGQVGTPPRGHRHWLTIDCRFLPHTVGPRSGSLSVYTEEDDRGGVALHDPLATLNVYGKGRRLYARYAPSLPPLEAVFLFGAPAVREWFGRMGWDEDLGMNGPLPDRAIQEAYAEAQRNDLPIDGEHVFAVLGGWNVPWPDGDWLELVDHPLVVMTLAESEPWVEVFGRGDSFVVVQRVS